VKRQYAPKAGDVLQSITPSRKRDRTPQRDYDDHFDEEDPQEEMRLHDSSTAHLNQNASTATMAGREERETPHPDDADEQGRTGRAGGAVLPDIAVQKGQFATDHVDTFVTKGDKMRKKREDSAAN